MSEPTATPPLELWGGIESTINRVGATWFDQAAWSGHYARPRDLDRIAALGIRTLRYPVLWERVAPDRPDQCDWSLADARLARMRRLGVRPIVGLVHHGSGPRYTSLTDLSFAEGLAEHARRVAERFPHVGWYTPVNEPLTTARFSGLYGHWYPHGRDGNTFLRCLLNQCRAVVLAMRAVRAVRSDACLVQTEDLGKTYGTPLLAYQAEFENERRWLTFDLLCGRVGRDHPLASYLRFVGLTDDEWLWFQDNPCPPDVLGVNHYLTSERFLDEHVERYPPQVRGGNGRHYYADVEAVRVLPRVLPGPAGLLREAWGRYRRALAVTEVHLGCTREEQLRWLAEVWHAARAARAEGVDVRAVTAWSLLGSYDWDSLVTAPRGHYEAGAFDVSCPRPRPTALAHLARQLAGGQEPQHPVLASPGWWRRPNRLTYSAKVGTGHEATPAGFWPAGATARPILIAGAGGSLGQEFARACETRGLVFRALGRKEMDAARPAAVEAALARYGPWAVVNAAGFSRVDASEQQPCRCHRDNVAGAVTLAAACRERGVRFLTVSSHLVFDGKKDDGYVEGDPKNPLCTYGRSKAEAEHLVLSRCTDALVVRAGPLFSPADERGLPARALRAAATGRSFTAAEDIVVSPSYAPDLVRCALDLLIDGEVGLWHLANLGAYTCVEIARDVLRRAGFDAGLVEGRPAAELNRAARRPSFSALGSERGSLMPTFVSALARFCEAVRRFGARAEGDSETAEETALAAPRTLVPGLARGT